MERDGEKLTDVLMPEKASVEEIQLELGALVVDLERVASELEPRLKAWGTMRERAAVLHAELKRRGA